MKTSRAYIYALIAFLIVAASAPAWGQGRRIAPEGQGTTLGNGLVIVPDSKPFRAILNFDNRDNTNEGPRVTGKLSALYSPGGVTVLRISMQNDVKADDESLELVVVGDYFRSQEGYYWGRRSADKFDLRHSLFLEAGQEYSKDILLPVMPCDWGDLALRLKVTLRRPDEVMDDALNLNMPVVSFLENQTQSTLYLGELAGNSDLYPEHPDFINFRLNKNASDSPPLFPAYFAAFPRIVLVEDVAPASPLFECITKAVRAGSELVVPEKLPSMPRALMNTLSDESGNPGLGKVRLLPFRDILNTSFANKGMVETRLFGIERYGNGEVESLSDFQLTEAYVPSPAIMVLVVFLYIVVIGPLTFIFLRLRWPALLTPVVAGLVFATIALLYLSMSVWRSNAHDARVLQVVAFDHAGQPAISSTLIAAQGDDATQSFNAQSQVGVPGDTLMPPRYASTTSGIQNSELGVKGWVTQRSFVTTFPQPKETAVLKLRYEVDSKTLTSEGSATPDFVLLFKPSLSRESFASHEFGFNEANGMPEDFTNFGVVEDRFLQEFTSFDEFYVSESFGSTKQMKMTQIKSQLDGVQAAQSLPAKVANALEVVSGLDKFAVFGAGYTAAWPYHGEWMAICYLNASPVETGVSFPGDADVEHLVVAYCPVEVQ